jgi:hypothetical protein
MTSIKIATLFAARALGLFWLSRLLTRSKVRILCYHGGNLGDERHFNPLLFCRGEVLDQRLSWLRKKGFSITSLEDAVGMLRSPTKRPALPTVLTFDDGWYSTFASLHPVVARHGVPATLYLSTGYFVAEAPNVEVVLSYLLRQARTPTFVLSGLDASVDGPYDIRAAAERRRFTETLTAWLSRAGGDRARSYRELEQVASSMGVTREALGLDSRRFDFVSAGELREMAAQGWAVELHGHVHRYPGVAGIQSDLARCTAEIEAVGLPTPRHYCYPSGDHDDQAHRGLAACGAVSATTCIPGLVGHATAESVFYLPRFLDGDAIHPLVFESEASGFSDFIRRLGRAR